MTPTTFPKIETRRCRRTRSLIETALYRRRDGTLERESITLSTMPAQKEARPWN